ncbi:Fic/DOC family protein [Fusobacterium sp. PH5-44]|uniref:Fic/DOC family protein n=1 Tax=unclassified Fusobacterium TaxID=2648384 RepID=UPI003D1E9435
MDKYVYPNTTVLKNKLNIRIQEELSAVERRNTSLRYLELENNNAKIERTFDFQHLKKIHKYLFQDTYSWAGEVRDVDIAKGNSLFCRAIHIEGYAEDVFNNIKKNNYFIGNNNEELSLKLAETLLDLNALHPFREGNGRTQREFIRELAEERGYKLSFEHFTQKEMIELSDLTLNPKVLADKLIQGMEKVPEKNIDPVADFQKSYNAITGTILAGKNSDSLKDKTKDSNFTTNAYIDSKNVEKLGIKIKDGEKPYILDNCVTMRNNKIMHGAIKVYNIDQLVITKEIKKLFKAPNIKEVKKEKAMKKREVEYER